MATRGSGWRTRTSDTVHRMLNVAGEDGSRARLVRQATLLGPLDGVDLAAEIAAFGVDGPVALVTAGWEEGEAQRSQRRQEAWRRVAQISTSTAAARHPRSDPGYADAERLLRTPDR